MEHIIKPIPGFLGYFADDNGNIYSKWGRGLGNQPNKKLHKLSPLKSKKGYLFLSIKISTGIYKRCGVHRLVCLAFNGIPEKRNFETSHLDGDRRNNIPKNLIWESKSKNHQRKILHGTHDRGYFNKRAKINKIQLTEIRKLLNQKQYTHKEIGDMFGLQRAFISKINAGYRYKNV